MSLAVTATVVLPTVAPAIVTMLPDTETDARAVSAEVAAYSRASPSGSAKWSARSTTTVSPTCTLWSPIRPVTTGGRFGTATSNACSAVNPPGSAAVTVTVAAPEATPVTVSTLPDISTVARVASDDAAEYSSESLSGSVK